jgi:hypothetical protein
MAWQPDAVMPRVQQRPDAGVGIACVKAYGEDFRVDERVLSGPGSVLVVMLKSVIVREIFAL